MDAMPSRSQNSARFGKIEANSYDDCAAPSRPDCSDCVQARGHRAYSSPHRYAVVHVHPAVLPTVLGGGFAPREAPRGGDCLAMCIEDLSQGAQLYYYTLGVMSRLVRANFARKWSHLGI
jgi:hypothetical protein